MGSCFGIRKFGAAVCLVLALTAQAQITFTFNFNDSAGTGFNDATFGAARQAALQSAASTLASYFTGYTQTITYNVVSNAPGGTLARADAAAYETPNTFQPTLIQNQILQGVAPPIAGNIAWNFAYSWTYSGTVAAGTYDFQAVAMHELLHSFGFISFTTTSAGAGLSGGNTRSVFDGYLTNGSGTPLFLPNATFNSAGVGSILTDGFSGDVFFSGANAVAAFGGLVPIYSPAVFLYGSSLSHLDGGVFGNNTVLMTQSFATGPAVTSLNAVELGMLRDLGYSAVPEPAITAWFLGLAALLLVVQRRRRSSD
jgi:MYXO-CTERM domain-containing protein